MTFRFIRDHAGRWPVRLMWVLAVSASGYYAWRRRPDSARLLPNRKLLGQVRRLHAERHGRYGSPRMHAALRAEGRIASRARIEAPDAAARDPRARRPQIQTIHDQQPSQPADRAEPAARALARLLTAELDHLSRMDAILLAAVEAEVPAVAEARSAMLRFLCMIRDRQAADLDAWISDARATLIASFAAGITRDRPAVAAALTQPWSNGQTEGQITRLKLVERRMFGRGKLDLLQARMIGASQA